MKECKNKYWSEVSWHDVKPIVQKCNSELAEILEQLELDKKVMPSLFRIKYPFGDEIVLSGKLQLPCNCENCNILIENLTSRNKIPLGVVLQNRIEVLTKGSVEHQTTPLRLLKPGNLFGVFEIADELHKYDVTPTWTLNSGVRTIIPVWQFQNQLLQNAIHDVLQNIELEELSSLLLNNRSDSMNKFWPIIRTMARQVDPKWMSEVLFLDADWSNLALGNVLRSYLFETAWNQSRELREKGQSEFQQDSQFVSHIIRILRKESIGFTPKIKNTELGPFPVLQKALFTALLNQRKNSKSNINLPLLLLPSILGDGITESDVVYFSFNNEFVDKHDVKKKYSQVCRDVAIRTKLKLSKLDDVKHLGVDFFVADTVPDKSLNDTNKSHRYVELHGKYRKDFCFNDFENQLLIAKDAGWKDVVTPESVITNKSEGFFASFVRISYSNLK